MVVAAVIMAAGTAMVDTMTEAIGTVMVVTIRLDAGTAMRGCRVDVAGWWRRAIWVLIGPAVKALTMRALVRIAIRRRAEERQKHYERSADNG